MIDKDSLLPVVNPRSFAFGAEGLDFEPLCHFKYSFAPLTHRIVFKWPFPPTLWRPHSNSPAHFPSALAIAARA